MSGRIDFHAHILPRADHGCDCVQTALIQLSLAEAAGVETVVAAPHFYPDRRTDGFEASREAGLSALRAAYSGPVTVLSGAEVFLCAGLQHHPLLPRLCVEGTKTLLIEMPSAPWPDRYVDTLCEIRDMGCTPVLAHIERYPGDDIAKLLARGFIAQLNAGCLLRPLSRRKFIRLIDEGRVHALGSDIHGQDNRAYRDFDRAMERLGPLADTLSQRTRALLA